MLKIIHSAAGLDFGQLMQVYAESNRLNGKRDYPRESENMQILLSEQDFCAYLQEYFKDSNARYALWEAEDGYKSALRLERYADGYLIAGLETVPEARRKGYAGKLIKALQLHLSKQGETKLYSHVDKRNLASINTHIACGFRRSSEFAVYLDGSILHTSCTFSYVCK